MRLYINATLTGNVQSNLGGAAVGVTVSVTDSNSNVINTNTDASGNFTIVGTGTTPTTSFRKGVNYTISFTSGDYNNASSAANSVVAGSNTQTPNPVTLTATPDSGHKVTGKVIDYWDNFVGTTLAVDSARVEVDDESGTQSVTADASGNFTVTVNVVATKTYNIRVKVPVTGSMVGLYTGESTTTTTAKTFVATNVAEPPATAIPKL